MPFGHPDTFTVEKPNGGWVTSPWAAPDVISKPYQTDENLKKAFGIELAKADTPFEAACELREDTSEALWISVNWLIDPVVIAARDTYLKNVETSSPPLDKAQLAAKVLALSEEKILKNGVMTPSIEAKDRIAALKLYSDIMGYTGKVEIDNSTKNFTHNEMIIKLVKPSEAKATVIDHAPKIKSENANEVSTTPITLKLVGASR